MNALTFKSIFLPRHAQHVVLIHFPIALFLIGVLFDVLARLSGRETFRTVALYNIVTAAIFAIPVVITGLLAWQCQMEGQKLKGVLLLHLLSGALSALLISVTAFLHAKAHRRQRRAPAYLITIEIVAAIIVAATAHLGGILSGVNSPA